uniref:Carboxylic ester hydrolase n=1 Tax=Cyberlindnera americana TaxID=36016 RepID=A0A5P8N986_9ASCO|nr:carboxylesterase [Cyberlindnera americana]
MKILQWLCCSLFFALYRAQCLTVINNGTIKGLHIPSYNQDIFLGIPYAQPPIGERRLAPPKPIERIWKDVLAADQYGPACWATQGTDTIYSNHSEDCLSINVVVPNGDYSDLPVAVWIHGGGFSDGSASRPAYNLSDIVQNGVEMGKPFIGLSFNYRLGGFGFMSSSTISQKGWTNVGLQDQIMAIQWTRENIAAFGGDPNHIVLWGESAGGISIGKLLLSGEVPFIRGAIMESGTGIFRGLQSANNANFDADYNSLVEFCDCTEADDTIECLQNASAKKLQFAFNETNGVMNQSLRFPYIDGSIISKSSFEKYEQGQFTRVPILVGANSDEGSVFTPPTINSQNSSISFLNRLSPNLLMRNAKEIVDLYPVTDPSLHFPLQPDWEKSTPANNISNYVKSTGRLIGDMMFESPSRWVSEFHSLYGSDVFKYRFNIPSQELFERHNRVGASHFGEVPYVFYNGQPSRPYRDSTEGHKWLFDNRAEEISKKMSQLWVSFITDLDPNGAANGVHWTNYKEEPKNLVITINGFYEEEDDYRTDQFDFLKKVYNQLEM